MSGRTDGLPTEDHLELPGYGAAEPLAQGGFSTIYRVHQPQFDRLVAVKVLGFALTDYKAQRRFQRECRLAGRLSAHPNIVTVHDAGIAPDGRPYITMEYLAAGSIADRIRRDGPFKVSDALRIGIACAGALETAHRAGVIHRDVKPANILLTSYGQPALADFGLSVLAERQKMTTSAEALTPYHAPPEMLERSAATPRSDVYSLASSLYTMLAGRAPHQGVDDDEMSAPTVGELLLAILQQDVPPIGRHDIPQALEGALSGALARDPNERTPSALAFAEALQEVQLQLGYEVTDPVVIDVDTGEAPGTGGAGGHSGGAGDRSVSPRSPSVSPSPSASQEPGQRHDLPDIEIDVGDSFWQPSGDDDPLDDPLGDLGDTTVDRSALLRPLPRPLTRQPARHEREPAEWWKVGTLVAAAVVVFLLGLLLLTGGGGDDENATDPADEDVDLTNPTATTVDAGEAVPDPDDDAPEGQPEGGDRPENLTATPTEAGVNLAWDGDEDARYLVLLLSETDPPELLRDVAVGPSHLVPSAVADPGGDYCFAVVREADVFAAGEDGQRIDPSLISPPRCINDASEDTVRQS